MKVKIIAIVCLFAIATAFASAFLDFFQAKSENGVIKLEWKTGDEKNLKEFQVERRTVNSQFIPIAAISPKGSNSYYIFQDENTLKPTDQIYVYRIRIVESDGSYQLSREVTVNSSVSGIKRTWGSIKAMFR